MFSALTSLRNSCHFYPAAHWTSSLPFLRCIYLFMGPKLNLLCLKTCFFLNLLHLSKCLPHSFCCLGPKSCCDPWLLPFFHTLHRIYVYLWTHHVVWIFEMYPRSGNLWRLPLPPPWDSPETISLLDIVLSLVCTLTLLLSIIHTSARVIVF